jgi:TolA-binding protein
MSRVHKALVVLVVAALGVWGCAQGPAPQGAVGHSKKIEALETRYAQKEDECRALAAARDQVRKKLAAVEEQRLLTLKELEQQKVVQQERDELRQQLQSRTSERDALQSQFEQFRKAVRSLLQQADTAATTAPSLPPISATETGIPGKS